MFVFFVVCLVRERGVFFVVCLVRQREGVDRSAA